MQCSVPALGAWRAAAATVFCGVVTAFGIAQTVTVDNSDPQFSILYGTWNTGAYGQPHGADYRWAHTTGYGYPPAAAEWRPQLPLPGPYRVSIWYVAGSNRAANAPFTVHHVNGDTTVIVNQQINGQTWFELGIFDFAAGTDGYVLLTNAADPYVVIADAVQFAFVGSTVELTMAVSPAGAGTTDPPAGGPYVYGVNSVVPIAASPAGGWDFHHWTVSAGLPVADPYSPSTTVTMDQSKTVTAVFVPSGPPAPEFRAFWADAFHAGFKSVSEIDTMISWALAGNYNAIIAEVLAFQDQGANGHGAYWNSGIVPRAADIVGGIDPLAELVQRAHAAGLQVHAWLVAFRVSSSWPPAGNPILAAHPEWLMVRQADMNQGPRPLVDGNPNTTDYYTLDPGSPDVQQYLTAIVRELVTNYAIDGIHWDYIRYTQVDAGYPTDLSYDRSTLRRFQAITGYPGVPAPTGVTAWDDFRRRTITELVRRTMPEVATIPNPQQPLRHTAALITWYPASANFQQTNAYRLFCDWKYWQQQGYLDATVPMCYFDEGTYGSTYRAWVQNSIQWAYDYARHVYIGVGIYLNTFADSVTQMLYARSAGAHGLTTYSYMSTNDAGQPWSTWYLYAAANVFTAPVPVPAMPWRDPLTATQGNVYGRVTIGTTGAPLDNATILLAGIPQVQTDGNGFYVLTRLSATPAGNPLPLSAAAPGFDEVLRPAVRVMPAGFTEANFALGGWKPGDYDVDGDVDLADFGRFVTGWTGPESGPPPPGADLFDFDDDADVDLADLVTFQRAFGT